MSPVNEQTILDIYKFVMEDIKTRIASVSYFLSTLKNGTEYNIAYAEGCYLQLRKISELLAIALAAAHNQIPDFQRTKVLKAWQADKLVNGMLKLNAKAFPNAVKLDTNSVPAQFLKIETGFGPKHFCNIYRSCGEKLHMGSLNNLITKQSIYLNLADISDWTSDFIKLLSNHLIDLTSINKILVCSMNSLEHGGNVTCYLSKEVKL